MALAAPERVRVVDPLSVRWWVTELMLQITVLVAYAASSLPKWANWEDGSKLDRLTITQGVLISLLAGNVSWMLTYHVGNADEGLAWVTAVLAGYFGDAYLKKKFEQLTGASQPAPAQEPPRIERRELE